MTIYMTDYGPVRVSESEAHTLRTAEDVRRAYFAKGAMSFETMRLAHRVIARGDALKAACERVAKFKAGIE